MFTGWHDIEARPRGWHKGAILTAQVAWELDELVKIYDRIAPRRVLEIGSQLGGTLWYWLDGALPGTVVANIDILQNQPPEVAEALPGRWQGWCPADVTLHTIIGRSDAPETVQKVKAIFPDGLDFLFIDACHTYEGAKRDFVTYGPLVRKGGIIALHDLITPEKQQHIQVWLLWREIQAAGYVTQELKAGGDAGGIGVIYV